LCPPPSLPPVPLSAERVSDTSFASWSAATGATRSSPSPVSATVVPSVPTVGPIPDGDHSPPHPAALTHPTSPVTASDTLTFTKSFLPSALGLATKHESCQGHASFVDTPSHRHLPEGLDGAPHRTTGLNDMVTADNFVTELDAKNQTSIDRLIASLVSGVAKE